MSAGKMAAELARGRLPAAQRLGRGRQAGGEPEHVRQAGRRQRLQVFIVDLGRTQKRAVQQPHIGQRKRLRQQLNPIAQCGVLGGASRYSQRMDQ